MPTAPPGRRVALVTLGCGRNEVDSEELAGRLAADGWLLVAEPGGRRRGAGQHLRLRRGGQEGLGRHPARGGRPQGAAGRTKAVVAVGLPRRAVRRAAGRGAARGRRGARASTTTPTSPRACRASSPARRTCRTCPRDRRRLLPIAPADRARRPGPPARTCRPGVAPASGPQPLRMRLGDGPTAALKLASGCDRRCTFCAIPTFRGSFVSRRPHEVLAEAAWLAEPGRARAGARERELHVVREGPRRHPAARVAAARPRRASTASSGSGSAICSRPRCGRAWSRR